MSDYDTFDRALLRLLQTDARRTSEALGEAVGLSPSAVQRRLKHLRESGAIRHEIAVLDAGKLGPSITVLVQVVLERGRADIIDGFTREIASIAAVQQCYHATGDFDFLLVICVRDMEEYQRLTRTLFYANPNIQRFTTSVVIDTMKTGLQIPL